METNNKMSRSNVTHEEALRRLVAEVKLLDAKEVGERWNQLGGVLAVAEGVLRDGVEPEPVAYLRFRAAQMRVGNCEIDHNEWLETCHQHEIGDDKLPAFPVYAAPVAGSAAPSGEAIETAYEMAIAAAERWAAAEFKNAKNLGAGGPGIDGECSNMERAARRAIANLAAITATKE